MRYMAVDLGDKRTGLAVGDSITRIVTPAAVLEVPMAIRAGEALLEAIAKAAGQHIGTRDAALVIGLPLNMDASEGPRAAMVREFARRLSHATSLPVHFQDERLTSAQADWQMARSDRTHKDKKKIRDAIAAATLLQDYLATLPR